MRHKRKPGRCNLRVVIAAVLVGMTTSFILALIIISEAAKQTH